MFLPHGQKAEPTKIYKLFTKNIGERLLGRSNNGQTIVRIVEESGGAMPLSVIPAQLHAGMERGVARRES